MEIDHFFKTIISGSTNVLYTNRNDRRGRWLIRKKGITQPIVTRIWRKAVKTVMPSIVIDIGMNYGEIVLSTNYPKHVEIVGIEANQGLEPYITKSINEHPNREQMNVIYAFASNENLTNTKFYVDLDFSGISSGTLNQAKNQKEAIVKNVKIDSLFAQKELKAERVLFKIDIKGHEANALKGMERLLKESAGSIGIIEFDNRYLQNAGTIIDEFMELLGRYFSVYHPRRNRIIKFSTVNLQTLKSYFKKSYFHANLLLTTKEEYVSKLGYQITEYPSQ